MRAANRYGLEAMVVGGTGGKMKRKSLIAAALIVCATIVLVAVTIIRYVNNKQDAAWCHDHGYANYATNDGFCVGAGGKLIKGWSLNSQIGGKRCPANASAGRFDPPDP